jgi:general secretion pathway protein C
MLKKFAAAAVHFVFFALVMAIAAYWAVKIFTPSPTAAPPPLPPPPVRDPDPVAAARMFGKVERVQTVATNVQAIGAFAAGRDSSAVLSVDGRPARVFLLGQEVAPGMKLVSVTAEAVVLDVGGARQEVRLPARAVAAFGGAPPPPNFTREGNTLTAPSAGAVAPPGRPNLPAGVPMPPPQMPPPQMAAPPEVEQAPPPGTPPQQQ